MAKRAKLTEGVLSNKRKRAAVNSQTPSHAKVYNRGPAGVSLSATYQPKAMALSSLSQTQPKGRRKNVSTTSYATNKKTTPVGS